MEERTDYFSEDENDALRRYLEIPDKQKPGYFDVYEFELIIDYFLDRHDFKSAGEVIDYALKLHPNTMILLQKKAQLFISEGFHYKALNILKNIQFIETSNSYIFFLMGIAYSSLGEISKAISNFDKSMELGPEEKEEYLVNAGTTLEQIGHYDLAIRYFKKLLEENESNAIALYEMAFCCEKLNYDKQSIEFYKLYLFEDPYSRLAWTNLASVYYKIEEYEKSIEAIEFAIVIDPEYSFSYFQKGLSEIFDEKYVDGIESLKYFLISEPNDPEAHFYLGEAYAKLDKNRDAIKHFEKTVHIDTSHADAYYGLAFVYYIQGKYSNAFNSISKALNIDSGESDFWHLSALINQKLGNFEGSEQAFRKGITLDHSDPQIWIDYSELETGKKSINRKIKILSQAFEHFSEDAEINYRLAANLALAHNTETAVFHLDKALKAEPSKLEIFRKIYADKNSVIEQIIDQHLYDYYNSGLKDIH